MAAHSPGQRGPLPSGVLVPLLVLWTACAGNPAPPAPAGVPPIVAPVAAMQVEPLTAPPIGTLGPEILLPQASAADEPVAQVGDLVLRKSHAFSRLLTADPKLALSVIDLLVFDVLVARHAEQYGIRVDAEQVERLAVAEEQQIQQQVKAEFGGELTVGAYVWRIFGMKLADWQESLRMRTAQRLYQGYVIRYLGLREDRVLVRYLVHKDQKVVQEVVDKVRSGADFATLALRWSDDSYRRDGGLLPAFGRGFPHPVAEPAFLLQKGQVSAPFQATVGGESRWFAVFCVDRFDGRDVPFAQVRAEVERDLEARPLAPIETSSYTLRWRGQLERDTKAAEGQPAK